MRNVLVIWEEIPETTRFYLIPADNDTFEKLVKCHGKFINSDDMTPELEWLNDELESTDYEVESGKPIQLNSTTTVIWTGFVL